MCLGSFRSCPPLQRCLQPQVWTCVLGGLHLVQASFGPWGLGPLSTKGCQPLRTWNPNCPISDIINKYQRELALHMSFSFLRRSHGWRLLALCGHPELPSGLRHRRGPPAAADVGPGRAQGLRALRELRGGARRHGRRLFPPPPRSCCFGPLFF